MKREVPYRQNENLSISNIEYHRTRAKVTNENMSISNIVHYRTRAKMANEITSTSNIERHRTRGNVTIRTRMHGVTVRRNIRHRPQLRSGSRTRARRGASMARPPRTSTRGTATWVARQLRFLWALIIDLDHAPNLDETTERARRARHRWRRLLRRMVQNHCWAAQGFVLRCARNMPRRLDWHPPRGITMQGQRWGWREADPQNFGF